MTNSAASGNSVLNNLMLTPQKSQLALRSPQSASTEPVKAFNDTMKNTLNEVATAKANARRDQQERLTSKRTDQQGRQAAMRQSEANTRSQDRAHAKAQPSVIAQERKTHPVHRESEKTQKVEVGSDQQGTELPVDMYAMDSGQDLPPPEGEQRLAFLSQELAELPDEDLADINEGLADLTADKTATILGSNPGVDGSVNTSLGSSEDSVLAGLVTLDPRSASANADKLTPGVTAPPTALGGSVLADTAAWAVNLDAKTLKAGMADESLGNLSVGLSAEDAASAQESDSGLFALAKDLKLPFGKLLASVQANNEGQVLNQDQSLAKISSLGATAVDPTLESVNRQQESQAVNARGFVVQTGVPVTLGQPRWGQAVGERVLWLAAQNLSAAELRLDPPELGPMQVRITIQHDQASVSFSSPHLLVREALDQSAVRLREMFGEQGLNLVDVDVSDQSLARQQTANDSSSGGAQSDTESGENVEDGETLVGVAQVASLRLVDHYA